MRTSSQVFRFLILTMLGIINFLIFSSLAMHYYSGGTLENPQNMGYSFISNKFSDLGMTISYSGVSNKISFLLFNSSLILAGISLIPFILIITRLISANISIEKKKMKQLQILGIIAALNFSFVGLTPKNLPWAIVLHTLFQDVAFVGLFFFQIWIIYLLKKTKLSKILPFIFQIVVLIQGVYLLFLFRIIPATNEIHCIAQKIIVYAQLLSFLIQSLLLLLKEEQTRINLLMKKKK